LSTIIVVENVSRWPLHVPGTHVVSARKYLTDPGFSVLRKAAVYNMCRHYGYQTTGYYVSLLAAARGHRPLPSVATLQDLRISPLIRIASDDLHDMIRRSLAQIKSEEYLLSIYFGRNVAARYDRLAQALFNMFPAPFLRARFEYSDGWRLQSIRPIPTSEIPESHRPFVIERAREYFSSGARPRRRSKEARYDLAILTNPEEPFPPSDSLAIRRFVAAAREMGIAASVVTSDDAARIAEFDALFLRETTLVDHPTYRIARRAAAAGLVVIDHPDDILRCTNKVYQAEVFSRHQIACPRTMVVHADNLDKVAAEVGLPCVLKRPDSSFSQGVVKADDPDELKAHLDTFLEESDLVIAQEFIPSAFDWRIGVLDGAPLYACRYHMASGHWQIIGKSGKGKTTYGPVEAVPMKHVPPRAVRLAQRAARAIGDGLYGIDIKEVGRRFLVVEVNDNPTMESGCEDVVIGNELYLAVMRSFRRRLDARGAGRSHRTTRPRPKGSAR